MASDQPPLAGWHGSFFLRDPGDYFRLYPKGRVQFDFHGYLGAGVNELRAADGGTALRNRMLLRRVRLELAGEFMKRWSFAVGVEFGGQSTSNNNGTAETAASRPGQEPTAETARWAAIETPASTAQLADNWINYSVAPWLNFIFGQYDAPFSMESMTSDTVTTFMERNLVIRSFVVPGGKETGAMVWGEAFDKMIYYGVGAFGGDGQNRTQIDNSLDFMGRVFVRPLAGDKKGLLAKAQVGVSASYGERNQADVGYDYPSLTTNQGYALWAPTYRDSEGRVVHIIPSGAQSRVGGEFRLPIKIVDLRGEAYYVANNTREALEGFQLNNTERLGSLKGIGWYAQVSVWPLGDAFVNGDPGSSPRPTKIDFSKEPERKKGLEIATLVGGVHATYDGASRLGAYDERTPGSPESPVTDIDVMQIGLGVNYWHTRYIRASLNWFMYQTPGSGPADAVENLARVPGNTLQGDARRDAESMHEIGARIGVSF